MLHQLVGMKKIIQICLMKRNYLMSSFREDQNYWINPAWKVQKDGGKVVCDFPQKLQYDTKLIYDVCHAKNNEEVKQILREKTV